ncbi:MAG: hypothetical protein ACRBBO_12520 [Cognatishimia sp.]|uniref:hypothetical protein n=1 Tax=Cognatishimia sp. 1_MG-2023 TaxID=3062642 RepID=UPI0026E1B8BD|nr:hypothetical protein [Cognatishimia sp. 1_MG-2023]MDO6727852.1 hypothetical protein [Cognatishimia sp. 1_MG-2023]
MPLFGRKRRWTGLSRFIAVDSALGLVVAAVIVSPGLAVLSLFGGVSALLLRRRVRVGER